MPDDHEPSTDGFHAALTKQPRHWRTREDVFAGVWDAEVVPLLERDAEGALEATTIMEELRRTHGRRFGDKHLRTLQRRVPRKEQDLVAKFVATLLEQHKKAS